MYAPRQKSAVVFVLKALIPYSRENMLLAYKPNKFFNELEKISGYRKKTLRESFRRAEKSGLIITGPQMARLTQQGQKVLEPYIAKEWGGDAHLMIVFDIPEQQANKRASLRYLLKRWRFKQVQKSVWVSRYNQVKPVKLAVRELGLGGYVKLYECSQIFPGQKDK